ncbi:MAG: hypothetical protein Q8O89_07835, partial [Nanoarchaeota archaeon]|nr:hypothetical protein [Nanoarchaeota archaeon]
SDSAGVSVTIDDIADIVYHEEFKSMIESVKKPLDKEGIKEYESQFGPYKESTPEEKEKTIASFVARGLFLSAESEQRLNQYVELQGSLDDILGDLKRVWFDQEGHLPIYFSFAKERFGKKDISNHAKSIENNDIAYFANYVKNKFKIEFDSIAFSNKNLGLIDESYRYLFSLRLESIKKYGRHDRVADVRKEFLSDLKIFEKLFSEKKQFDFNYKKENSLRDILHAKTIDNLNRPIGVSFDNEGRLIVLNNFLVNLLVYDANLNLEKEIKVNKDEWWSEKDTDLYNAQLIVDDRGHTFVHHNEQFFKFDNLFNEIIERKSKKLQSTSLVKWGNLKEDPDKHKRWHTVDVKPYAGLLYVIQTEHDFGECRIIVTDGDRCFRKKFDVALATQGYSGACSKAPSLDIADEKIFISAERKIVVLDLDLNYMRALDLGEPNNQFVINHFKVSDNKLYVINQLKDEPIPSLKIYLMDGEKCKPEAMVNLPDFCYDWSFRKFDVSKDGTIALINIGKNKVDVYSTNLLLK